MSRDDLQARYEALLRRVSKARAAAARAHAAVPAESFLTAKQLEDYRHPAKLMASLWPRRTGKSYVKAAKLRRAALTHAGTQNPYIALTANNARRFFLPALLDVERRCGTVGRFNHGTLTMHYPNGSTIFLGGCETQRDRERYRGGSFGQAVLDECGAVFDCLTLEESDEFIGEILLPATLDVGGGLDLTGTPGRVFDGKWWEITGPNAAGNIPVVRATMADNTAVPGLWERALELKALMGWGDDHPTWLREYMARWARDESVLVLPWVRERNSVDRLPFERTDIRWRWVLGIDVGTVDAMAYTVQGAHPHDPCTYMVEAMKRHGQLITPPPTPMPERGPSMLEDIQMYRQRFPNLAIVIDTGGQGKAHVNELQPRLNTMLIAAEKTEKASAIRTYRDQIESGMVKTLAGQCDVFEAECQALRWDKRKLDFADGQEDHAAHAGMYGHRQLHHYLYRPQSSPMPEGDRLRAEWIRRARQQQGQRWAVSA